MKQCVQADTSTSIITGLMDVIEPPRSITADLLHVINHVTNQNVPSFNIWSSTTVSNIDYKSAYYYDFWRSRDTGVMRNALE